MQSFRKSTETFCLYWFTILDEIVLKTKLWFDAKLEIRIVYVMKLTVEATASVYQTYGVSMEYVQIDWLVVVLAAVINMLIGYFWYSKWIFGPLWSRYSKRSEKEMRGNGKTLFLTFVVSLVTAFFLAFFDAYLGVTSVTDGMFVGFLLWLGFVATTQIVPTIWFQKPIQLFMINSGYKLVSFLVMSGLIGA